MMDVTQILQQLQLSSAINWLSTLNQYVSVGYGRSLAPSRSTCYSELQVSTPQQTTVRNNLLQRIQDRNKIKRLLDRVFITE
jgi:hypothetical protein